MRILIADDHDMVRDAIAALVGAQSDIATDTASDLNDAIARIRKNGCYDLVLLDYRMPGMAGLNGLGRAIEANGDGSVAILSGTASRQVAEDAVAAGAAGFLPKTMAARSLVNAIRFMAAGEVFVPLDVLQDDDGRSDNPLAQKLTPREFDVILRLGRGLSNKEIARDLGLQEVTVKLHVKTLCRKLGAKNRTQAAMVAKDAGIL